ncbi:hypothetical protein GGI12_004364, partial [Dipsacomyces acuminosporus]
PNDYPQSDDPSTGHSALERKKKIDAVCRQGVELARQLGTSPLNRIEAADILSRSGWSIESAARRIQLILSTRDGIVYDINPRTQLCGAVNSHSTTCYIDSLLMALFGAQNSSDGLLYMRDLGSERANELQAMCRLLVNFIRAGELIDASLIEEMRTALIRCGWMCDMDGKPPSSRYVQQDVSELYLFLMDKLQMPYLAMEVRMVHGADRDEADNRMVTHRVLELSFPDPSSEAVYGADGEALVLSSNNPFASRIAEKPLLLQAMLERYFFDNRVEHLERILKSQQIGGGEEVRTKVHTNAWSFLSMYPFYTPQNELGDSTAEKLAAEYPEDAPLILPLLIKRYSVDGKGNVHRTNRRVIIPMVLDVTNIINTGNDLLQDMDDKKPESSTSSSSSDAFERDRQQALKVYRSDSGNADDESSLPPPYPKRIQYRLVLRAAICHKGTTVGSGHYVSFCTRLRLVRPGEIAQPSADVHGQGSGSQLLSEPSGKAATEPHPAPGLVVPNGIGRFRTLATDMSRERRGHTISSGDSSSSSSSFGQISRDVVNESKTAALHRSKSPRHHRRHSWPSCAVYYESNNEFYKAMARHAMERSRDVSDSESGASTPTPSVYNLSIHGTADDWANYAMTMNLEANGHSTSQPADAPPLPPRSPPPYSQPDEPGAKPPQLYVSTAHPGDEPAPKVGEFLRFDDMDTGHNRVQYFSTNEGGRQCMDEISRDGYMLFYALQKVELPDDNAADEGEKEGEGEKEAQSAQQAMEQLSSALQKDEQDLSTKRLIDRIVNSTAATTTAATTAATTTSTASTTTGGYDPAHVVLADYKDGGEQFEDMAMRWQNVRLDRLASPVGPLSASTRTPSPQPQRHTSRLSIPTFNAPTVEAVSSLQQPPLPSILLNKVVTRSSATPATATNSLTISSIINSDVSPNFGTFNFTASENELHPELPHYFDKHVFFSRGPLTADPGTVRREPQGKGVWLAEPEGPSSHFAKQQHNQPIDGDALQALLLTAAPEGQSASAAPSYQPADSDNDYLTFATSSTSYNTNTSTNTTNTNYSLGSATSFAAGKAAVAGNDAASLFDSFVANDYYSPDQQLMMESEHRVSAPALRHARTFPGTSPAASASGPSFMHPSDVFTTPLLADSHSLDAIAASLSSASLPATPVLPSGLFNGPATAPLRPISYSELPGLDSSTPAGILRSAFESYLNTPVNPGNMASPNVSVAQKALGGEAPLFAPLDEIKGKDALAIAALLNTPAAGAASTVASTPLVADGAEDVLEQLAFSDPSVRQSLVHALVDLIKPATAYQSVVSSSSAPQLSRLAHNTPASSLQSSQSTDVSSNEAPLIDTLLGILSPPIADVSTPAMVDSASPALLELLSPRAPMVMAPEDVFKTPHLPTIDEEDDLDEEAPLVEAVRVVRNAPAVAAAAASLQPKASNKRKRSSADDDDEEEAGGRKFHCDVCNRAFSRQYNMRTHRLTHDPNSNAARPFNCNLCSRSFTRKHDLTRHQVLHDDSNAFKCNTCGRGFARMDVLERHARAVHKSK